MAASALIATNDKTVGVAPSRTASRAGQSRVAAMIDSLCSENCPGRAAMQIDMAGQMKSEGQRERHMSHESANPNSGMEA